jgi:hypothetical protein
MPYFGCTTTMIYLAGGNSAKRKRGRRPDSTHCFSTLVCVCVCWAMFGIYYGVRETSSSLFLTSSQDHYIVASRRIRLTAQAGELLRDTREKRITFYSCAVSTAMYYALFSMTTVNILAAKSWCARRACRVWEIYISIRDERDRKRGNNIIKEKIVLPFEQIVAMTRRVHVSLQ